MGPQSVTSFVSPKHRLLVLIGVRRSVTAMQTTDCISPLCHLTLTFELATLTFLFLPSFFFSF